MTGAGSAYCNSFCKSLTTAAAGDGAGARAGARAGAGAGGGVGSGTDISRRSADGATISLSIGLTSSTVISTDFGRA
ncbi:MAG: hypothetical protein C0473_03700 [Cyanobacteria bacterium DS3.002]|nr:hypothetical protein [Cyanobacteria bacterium DS3.002]